MVVRQPVFIMNLKQNVRHPDLVEGSCLPAGMAPRH